MNRLDASRRTVAAVLLGVVLIGAGVAYALVQAHPRLGYSNQVPLDGPAAELPPGAEACQPDEAVPADAPAASVVIAGRQARVGPLELIVRDRGRPVVSARIASAPPGRLGYVRFELPKRNPELAVATVCVRNRSSARVALKGAPQAQQPNASPALPGYGPVPVVDGQEQPGRFRIDYEGPGSTTALAILPQMVERAGLVKGAVVGTWTIWLAFVAALAIGGLAVLGVLRSEQP